MCLVPEMFGCCFSCETGCFLKASFHTADILKVGLFPLPIQSSTKTKTDRLASFPNINKYGEYPVASFTVQLYACTKLLTCFFQFCFFSISSVPSKDENVLLEHYLAGDKEMCGTF